jgi:hypothetical protein
MLKVFGNVILIIGFSLFSGCSVYMAASQPTKKDLAILNTGTDRDYVIAEFGAPVVSELTADGKKEILVVSKQDVFWYKESIANHNFTRS